MAKKWEPDLSGTINQNASPQLLGDNQFEILVNVMQGYTGMLAKRPGATLLGAQISASNPIRGLHAYNKNNGNHYFHAIHQGILYVYDEGTSTWTSQENAAGTGLATDSEVSFANHANRHYFIGDNSDEYLRYATESGSSTQVTLFSTTASSSSTGTTLVSSTAVFQSGMVGMTVVNTTDTATAVITAFTDTTTVTLDTSIGDDWDGDSIVMYMDGKYLASNGAFMLVVGSDVYPDRAFWTGLGTDTFDTTSDYAITEGRETGVATFGNGRPFVVFTEDGYTHINPSNDSVDSVRGFGCTSHRSIANLKGGLVWLGRQGFSFMAYNQAFPEEISKTLRNDKTGDAIMNKIADASFEVAAAGVINDRYYCALRNLSATVKGQTLNDCVVEFDYSTASWRVHTFTQGGLGSVFASFVNSDGLEKLYTGSVDAGAVFMLEDTSTVQDDNAAGTAADVPATIISKHYNFGNAESWEKKDISKLIIQYKSDTELTVSYSADGDSTYTAIGRPLPIANTKAWYYKYFSLGTQCRTLSHSITSTGGDFRILGWGHELTNTNTIGIDPV